MVGRFGKVFNLAIWWSRRKSPNLIPPILNSVALAAQLHKRCVHHALYQCFNAVLRHALNCSPTCSKTVSPRITASTHRRRGQRCEGMAPKTSRPRLLDKILDGGLPWGNEALLRGGYVIFLVGVPNRQVSRYMVYANTKNRPISQKQLTNKLL